MATEPFLLISLVAIVGLSRMMVKNLNPKVTASLMAAVLCSLVFAGFAYISMHYAYDAWDTGEVSRSGRHYTKETFRFWMSLLSNWSAGIVLGSLAIATWFAPRPPRA